MSRLRSIRQKLTAVVLATTLAALLVSVGTVIAYDLRNYHSSLLGDMSTRAELLGHMTSAALTFDDPRLAKVESGTIRLSMEPVALTANAMPGDVERGLASGFFRYLTKPINIDEFSAAIDSTLAYVDGRRNSKKAQQQ